MQLAKVEHLGGVHNQDRYFLFFLIKSQNSVNLNQNYTTKLIKKTLLLV